MSHSLFSPVTIRGLTLRNRIVMSPMCQYLAVEGCAQEWHRVHYGIRAVGGVGAIVIEATGVVPEGRITQGCLGLWNDAQGEALRPVIAFAQAQGVKVGVQLAHAGRKSRVSEERAALGLATDGLEPVAPSPLAFDEKHPTPRELTPLEIHQLVRAFVAAAQRAVGAGADFVEVHAAHGYLLHQFLSPLSNQRSDEWGGGFYNRTRFLRKVVAKLRQALPELPLWLRLSATDYVPGGWDLEQTLELAKALQEAGADLIDVSSGGSTPNAVIPYGPGYQVAFAERVKQAAPLLVGAVGALDEPARAAAVLREEKADLVFLGKALLRDPFWPQHAALALGEVAPKIPSYGWVMPTAGA